MTANTARATTDCLPVTPMPGYFQNDCMEESLVRQMNKEPNINLTSKYSSEYRIKERDI